MKNKDYTTIPDDVCSTSFSADLKVVDVCRNPIHEAILVRNFILLFQWHDLEPLALPRCAFISTP